MQIYSKINEKWPTSPLFRNHNRSELPAGTVYYASRIYVAIHVFCYFKWIKTKCLTIISYVFHWMHDICSCDNCSSDKHYYTNIKHNSNPNPNPNPNPNLNPYSTPNQKPNHYTHSNSLLLEISSQDQFVAGANVGSPFRLQGVRYTIWWLIYGFSHSHMYCNSSKSSWNNTLKYHKNVQYYVLWCEMGVQIVQS